MADIFEEVEEEVRRDRAMELWRRYGILVWLLAAGLVIAVGVREVLQARAEATREARAERLEAARDLYTAGDYDGAEAAFAALVAEGSPMSPLAAHYLAVTRLEGSGDTASAADALLSVAAADGDPFQTLALLKAAYLKADALSLSELEALIGALADEASPAGALAQELIAAKAYQAGDIERARQGFNYLRFAPNVPRGVSERARVALAALPPASSAPAPETDTDTPAPAPVEEPTP